MNQTGTLGNIQGFGDQRKVKVLSARGITVIALLSALSTVLMYIEVPLWFAPSFYKIDFSEIPVLIGTFALGPVAGILIELIKNLLHIVMKGTDTAFVGNLANFLVGCALVVPSGIFYLRSKTRKAAIVGMAVGTLCFVVIGCLLNAYFLLPAYAKMFNMPIDTLIAMGTAVNPKITGLSGFIFMAVVPFNLLKGVLVSVATILLYKRVSPIVKGFHR